MSWWSSKRKKPPEHRQGWRDYDWEQASWKKPPRPSLSKHPSPIYLGITVFLLTVFMGVAYLSYRANPDDAYPNLLSIFPSSESGRFSLCGVRRQTCVVDGDTFWLRGVKYRIADIDTPEISAPQCAYELELGNQARDRLLELLNAGPIELRATARTDEDRFGRKLRSVYRNGQSLGARMVSEGLARRWTGRREPWCQ